MKIRHLALLVRDIHPARRFYERYFEFNGESEWMGGDVLFIRNHEGFDLALMKGDHPANPGAFHHFGFQVADRQVVTELRKRMEADRVPIIELVDEPDQFSFKCVDPDGYTVEVYAAL